MIRTQLTVIALVLLAGCATQPAAETPAAAPHLAARSSLTTPDGTPSELTPMQAKALGYKIVNQNGKQLYCRKQRKTGSHIQVETICMTAEELQMARDASQRNLEQMQRATAIPQGK